MVSADDGNFYGYGVVEGTFFFPYRSPVFMVRRFRFIVMLP